jgi:hypothetical protein
MAAFHGDINMKAINTNTPEFMPYRIEATNTQGQLVCLGTYKRDMQALSEYQQFKETNTRYPTIRLIKVLGEADNND